MESDLLELHSLYINFNPSHEALLLTNSTRTKHHFPSMSFVAMSYSAENRKYSPRKMSAPVALSLKDSHFPVCHPCQICICHTNHLTCFAKICSLSSPQNPFEASSRAIFIMASPPLAPASTLPPYSRSAGMCGVHSSVAAGPTRVRSGR